MPDQGTYKLYQPGFAQYQRSTPTRVRKGKQARLDFQPTEKQELTAIDRIEGKLKKCPDASFRTDVLVADYDGNVEIARQEALRRAANQLVPFISCRGDELGRGRWELEITLQRALERGIEDGKFEVVTITDEMLIKLKEWRMTRRNTYKNRPSRSRRTA